MEVGIILALRVVGVRRHFCQKGEWEKGSRSEGRIIRRWEKAKRPLDWDSGGLRLATVIISVC